MISLHSIRTFPQLVRYLEDELEWPLEGYDIEDLTFDYEPDELGLKAEDAAKVKSIRQLRPLDSKQPWGIFFIEFDRKKLPVVVLRRILSHLVVKKRASANKADRVAWSAEDLLFISAFGAEEDDGREISFAHFHQEEGDMPTLRVLGWDGGDTKLKLDHLATTLKQRLHWPDAKESLDHWRARWAGVFRHRIGHVINTSDMLAEAMAVLAKRIRDAAQTLIDRETDKGPLRKLHQAFKTHLIHDLTEEGFADTYAQTITYGLLTAAISRTEMSGGKHGTALVASNVTDMVPVTNPFLKEMLQTFLHVGGRKGGIDFDELGVQDVVELLRGDETDLPAILRDFGNKTRGEDPVIHFYEHFLNAYNKKLRIQRGVFYTPNPVVSYIVRSVHELLQTEFHLEHGLADTTTWGEFIQKSKINNPQSEIKLPPLTDEPGCTETISPDEHFVQILDPATGTATFPVEVIDVIYKHLKELWKKGGIAAVPQIKNPKSTIGVHQSPPKDFSAYWNHYVPHHLLPRLHAYELMMAPYAIAHMKLGLKLAETGYHFATEERARIYLTNALEPWQKQLPLIGFDALAHEAAAVNEIKRHKRFTVVIGNPPYSNYGMLNKNPFILGLLEDYKRGLDEKKLNLDDDFIKFVRFSQHHLDMTRVGIVGMITNNVFLDGLSHRQMRESLRRSFLRSYFLNLHGDTRKKEEIPAGAEDKNVFDIQQGVSVSLLSKIPNTSEYSNHHADLWGARDTKYRALERGNISETQWKEIIPASPYFFFVPKDFADEAEYFRGVSAKDIFVSVGKGVKTERDRVSIHFTEDGIKQSVNDFRTDDIPTLKKKYLLDEDSRDWKVASAKADVAENIQPSRFRSILYRPFDVRHTWYSGQTRGFIGTPGYPVLRHMLEDNFALILTRQVTGLPYNHCFAARTLVEIKCASHDRCCDVVPLRLYNSDTLSLRTGSSPNLKPNFLKSLSVSLQLAQVGEYGLPTGLTPEDIFHYIYAVFHSPGYRSRYAEFLKIDFPRVPLTGKLALFRELSRLGGELVALHLLESPKLDKPITGLIGKTREVTRIGWANDTVWLDAPATKKGATQAPGTSGFRGVPEAVWNFHIGGYQVCQKWLKDRKGRTLTEEDIAHYHKIVIALTETLRLMSEIDQVIDSHGGWPGAFQTDK
jgi:hypothetical protein